MFSKDLKDKTSSIIKPTSTCWRKDDARIIFKPLEMIAKIATPSIAPVTFPPPPFTLIPPSMLAAIDWSNKESATSDLPLDNRAAKIIPAKYDSTPAIM